MNGRQIVIPTGLKQQVLDPTTHKSYGYQKKTKLFAHESVYGADINTDIEKHIKNCTTYQVSADITQGENSTS